MKITFLDWIPACVYNDSPWEVALVETSRSGKIALFQGRLNSYLETQMPERKGFL